MSSPGTVSGVRTHRRLILGAGLGAALSVAAVAGALLGWWWLVVLCAMVLLSAVLLVALDLHRRVRDVRVVLGTVAAPPPAPPAPTPQDVVGTVRALQAQYTGRLDRLQDALEARAHGDDAGR